MVLWFTCFSQVGIIPPTLPPFLPPSFPSSLQFSRLFIHASALLGFFRKSKLCNAVTRTTFMEHPFPEARHVVMDEVHNCEQPDPRESWYQKARQIVRQHNPDNPGYLWLFADKCQTDHTFPTGMPPEAQQQPSFRLSKVIRNSGKIFNYSNKYLSKADVKGTLVLGHDFEGENVEDMQYSKSRTVAQSDVLNEIFPALFKEGYIYRDVAVLFAKQDFISERLLGDVNVPTCTARGNNSDKVVISTVNKYSGLERPIVILFDLDSSVPHRRIRDCFIYSAVTRAMVKLIIIRCQHCRSVITALQKRSKKQK